MSSFLEYKVNNQNLKQLRKIDCDWSPTGSMLAISVYSIEFGSSIHFVNENGTTISEDSDNKNLLKFPFEKESEIFEFVWHPKLTNLVVVWESGELGVFLIKKTRGKWIEASQGPDNPERPKLIIRWVNDSYDFITIDISNVLTIWHVEEGADTVFVKANIHLADRILDYIIVKVQNTEIMYFGSSTGVMYQSIVLRPKITDVLALESGIKKMLFYPKKNRLILITESMLLCQYNINPKNLEISELFKVKLSSSARGKNQELLSIVMIDEMIGLIAIVIINEQSVRLWQLENGQNAAIMIGDSTDYHSSGISLFDYCNKIMAVATSNNKLTIFRRVSGFDFNKVALIHIKEGIDRMSISNNHQIACIASSSEVYLIDEQIMSCHYNNQIVAIQTGTKMVKIKNLENKHVQQIAVDGAIRNVYLGTKGKVVGIKLTGSKEIDFYFLSRNQTNLNSKLSSRITETNNLIMINEDEFVWSYTLNHDQNNWILNLISQNINTQKEEKHHIELILNTDNKNDLVKMISFTINKNYLLLIIFVDKKYFYYLFQVDGGKQKLKSGPSRIKADNLTSLSKINCDGTLIACIDEKRLIILPGKDQDKNEKQLNYEFNSDSEVTNLCWADNESRILCYSQESYFHVVLCNLKENLIKLYEKIENGTDSKLIAFIIPNIYLITEDDITKEPLKSFDGLNETTTNVMIDFLTSNQTDLNQIIQRINKSGENNPKLWNNLAKLSVRDRNVEMGIYCVSKLENARIVRDAKKELNENKDKNAALAILAMNLEMHHEAEMILKESDNKALLSKFYQGTNQWDKAIDCVDRLNVKSVYYNYAKHLELDEANVSEAIKYYEKSATHIYEVPRMLFDVEGNTVLQKYCFEGNENLSETDQLYLMRWWGQYSESQGNVDQALDAYEKANDYYNLVRLLCHVGKLKQAKSLINNIIANPSNETTTNSTKDAAMLHLGRHLESSNPTESITYYLSCGAIQHAIRVCKSNSMINELIKIVVNYGTAEEAKEMIDKYVDKSEEEISEEILVQLYYKCGDLDKAIESAFKTRSLGRLRELLSEEIAKIESEQETTINISDSTVQLAFQSLKEDSELIDIVIDLLLLVKNNQAEHIEKLIIEYNIEINEKLIEKVEKVVKNQSDNQVMITFADLALQQGQYLIAAKLYNNQGLRTNAIKALIRTGQTDKIISYANIARDKVIYKIAANYLEAVNYDDAKLIATFYRKSGEKR